MERKHSHLSDIEIKDRTHCILCTDELKYLSIGKCNHKNICATCALRLRLIIKDRTCPICKTELDEVFITNDANKNFDTDLYPNKEKYIVDKNELDEKIYYDSFEANLKCIRLRDLSCVISGCNPGFRYANIQELKKHLETTHRRTFCNLCVKSRLVFIREQKIYPVDKIQQHIDYGDYGGEDEEEILPHPWCNMCRIYLFNDEELSKHLYRGHMNCHICGDAYKHWYYKDYDSLAKHFRISHFLCPHEECLEKCFVVFATPEELESHRALVHLKGKSHTVQLNFGFGFDDEESQQKRRYDIKRKDKEGEDYSYYFSEAYKKMEHYRSGKEQDKYGNKHGPKGKHEDRKKRYHDEEKEAYAPPVNPIVKLGSEEEKIKELSLQLKSYLRGRIKREEFSDKDLFIHKDQVYQMTFIISKLDTKKILDLDYILNFGVLIETKKLISAILTDPKIPALEPEFDKINLRELLIVYKYFTIAHNKVATKFVVADMDKIQPDLLSDFRDIRPAVEKYVPRDNRKQGTNNNKKPQQQSYKESDKQQKQIVYAPSFNDVIMDKESMVTKTDEKGNMVLDLKSKDEFPNLEGFGKTNAPMFGKTKKKDPFAKKKKKVQTTAHEMAHKEPPRPVSSRQDSRDEYIREEGYIPVLYKEEKKVQVITQKEQPQKSAKPAEFKRPGGKEFPELPGMSDYVETKKKEEVEEKKKEETRDKNEEFIASVVQPKNKGKGKKKGPTVILKAGFS